MPLSSKRGREICFVVRKLIFCCMRENQRVDTLSERSLATNVIRFLIVVDPFNYIRTYVTGKCLCLGCYHVNVCSTLMWCWCNILFRRRAQLPWWPKYLLDYCQNTFNLEQSFFIVILLINNCEWSLLLCWQVHITSQLITMQWEHETDNHLFFFKTKLA